MSYAHVIAVEFNHCDPAGMVFYPRFFEMINSVVENFFDEELHYPFARMHVEEGYAVPTARIETEFHAPARLGERLRFDLAVTRLGRTSLHLTIRAAGGDGPKLTARSVLVFVDRYGRPTRWPEEVRAKLAGMVREEGDGGNPA